MGMPLLSSLRDVFAARTGAAALRAAAATLTTALVFISASLLLASGLAALTGWFGFPLAALVGAVLIALLAVAVHLAGRALVARRMSRARKAQARSEADLALAWALSRSARPLLPLAAFLLAFVLTRRS
ncbi:putative membrane protein YhdT [Roseovarius sp. MBR-38]|jgi:hypothetical protein